MNEKRRAREALSRAIGWLETQPPWFDPDDHLFGAFCATAGISDEERTDLGDRLRALRKRYRGHQNCQHGEAKED